MKAIDVLSIVDGLDDELFVDVWRQRQLHDKAVDGVIGIEPGHGVEQLLLCDIVFEPQRGGAEATARASAHLGRHIAFAGAVMPHEHSHQVRRPATGTGQRVDLAGYLTDDLFRYVLAVDERHAVV